MAFKKIDIQNLDMNTFQAIGKDWMLITAGDQNKINTMTASWGGMGVLWGENVVQAYIRPQRYTKQFVDEQSCFSLSFFDGYKKELSVLGTVSGRDQDKIQNVDFHPTFIDGVPTFEEAKFVFIVEKIYEDIIKPENFIDTSLDQKWYPEKDYHHVYIAKIKGVYQKV
ncbi:flavin reductase family protein [Allocoprobacillus halotolerans]|uniref:Flavin reductase family protein n=1 Tax=Allocoprobacillus halotolerans TaxID=2944914 RepID=A0ABY5HYY9_9FIRM|nr:flavin reductase family protein [Allocoprobacillus halotolerans]UTY38030.1 flavin reductase family protein [Allocoprobacillus halotolerans]